MHSLIIDDALKKQLVFKKLDFGFVFLDPCRGRALYAAIDNWR